MGVLSWNDAVDIGGGRGRLARDPAASLARVDAAMRSAFGRAADINEAWRSPEQANANYARYLAYLRGGPWAPIALPGDQSVHCFGGAVDTDDTSDAQMRIWNDHGWYWTVYRNGKLAERWHLEYFWWLDNHRFDGAPAAVTATPIPKEWDEMASQDEVKEAAKQALAEVLKTGTPRGVYIWTLNRGGALIDPAVGGFPLAGEEAEAARAIYGHGPELNDRQWDVALNLATRLAEAQAARIAAAMSAQQKG